MENPHHALVLDIGGSHVTAAVADLETRQILEPTLTHRSVNPDAPADVLLESWASEASKAWELAGNPPLAHIGVAMPGPFEYDTGVSRLEHKFASLYGQNVGVELKQRILAVDQQTVPIHFGNDATMFALGEWWTGAAQEHSKVIGVTLGTGLGGGFVQNGQVRYDGPDIPPLGGIWNLPYLNGIAEDQVSGAALTRGYMARANRQLKPVQIADLAQRGDQKALQAFSDFGQHLGNVLLPLTELFHPDCVVVGGNIARAWPLFREHLEDRLKGRTQVVVSTLFDRANLLGAAALRKEKV